jgi:hypothetical protein
MRGGCRPCLHERWIIAEELTSGVGSYAVLETATNCAQGALHEAPDLDTLACVSAECQLFRRAGASNLFIRKVYGPDCMRLLRCRSCGEEFSERRGNALFNTKLPELPAEEVINHLGKGYSVRAMARLVHVAKETVAHLVRVTGRHAEAGEALFWEVDGHPNAQGYAVIAEVVLAHLQEHAARYGLD